MQQNQSRPNQPGNKQSADPNSGSQTQQPTRSYVDSYQPPTLSQADSTTGQTQNSSGDESSQTSQPVVPIESPSEIKKPESTRSELESTPTQPIEPTQFEVPTQPAKPAASTTETEAAETDDEEQALELQNIFVLLGVTDSNQQEKEAFLDELQQVVWEDFLEHDLELLITEEEKAKVDELLAKSSDQAMQEELVVYLEKLIPDLEEIVYEKALELKADMVEERIAGMKDYYQDNAQAMSQIDQAEKLIEQNQWRTAAEVLNAI